MNNFTGPMVLVFVGAILSAAGAFWTAARQVQSANQRAEFEKALREKTDEINELNKQIAANVTVGIVIARCLCLHRVRFRH